jgi:ribosomal protein L21E
VKPGERVRIESHPALWPWAEEYVGEEGKILQVNENAAKVELADGPLWLAFKHLVSVEQGEEGVA